MKRMLGLLLLLALASLGFAQPDPNVPPPLEQRVEMTLMMLRLFDRMPPVMKATTDGLFLIHNGVLTKYDAEKGQLAGTLALFGEPFDWPPDYQPVGDDGNVFLLERMRRMMMPGITNVDHDLLIVIGGQFFRLDARTLEVKVAATVLTPDPLLEAARIIIQQDGMGMVTNPMAMFQSSQLEPTGRTLHLMQGANQVVSINIDTGAVVANQPLPPSMQQRLIPSTKAGPFAENPAPASPVDGKTFFSIGRLVVQPNRVVIKDETGVEYELRGNLAQTLAKAQGTDTARLLVSGIYQHTPATGIIEVGAYIELTTVKPE